MVYTGRRLYPALDVARQCVLTSKSIDLYETSEVHLLTTAAKTTRLVTI